VPADAGARSIARTFLDLERPKPSASVQRIEALVRWALEQGWEPGAVAEGLRQTSAFTVNALEYALRKTLTAKRSGVGPTSHWSGSQPPQRPCPFEMCHGDGWLDHPAGAVRCDCNRQPT